MAQERGLESRFPSRRAIRSTPEVISDAEIDDSPKPKSVRIPKRHRARQKAVRGSKRRILAVAVTVFVLLALLLVTLYVVWTSWSKQKSDPVRIGFQVSGRLGAAVTMKLDTPVAKNSVGAHTMISGDGRQIVPGKRIYARVTSFSGKTGKVKNTIPVQFLGKATPELLPPDLYSFIIKRHEGDRFAVIRDISPNGKGDFEISVIDILPTSAFGEVLPRPEGTQFWVEDKDSVPELVSFTDVDLKQVSSQLIIRGDGEQIRPSSDLLVQLKVVDASTGSVISSTWNGDGIPETIKINQLMKPVANALVDRSVGSRVAVLVPAAQADGNTAVFVIIDVIGIVS